MARHILIFILKWTHVGSSIFLAESSPLNCAFVPFGVDQTVYHAELAWLSVAFAEAWAPTMFYRENETVARQAAHLIDNPEVDISRWDNHQLWSDILTAISSAPL